MKTTEEKTGNRPLLVRLPQAIDDKLTKDAKKKKTTVQAVILGIVAEHYGVAVAPPRRGQPKKSVDE